MPYEIPQNLKYQEKIAFGLGFSQLGWLTAFGIVAATIWLKTPLPIEAKALGGILICSVGAGFAFFGFTEHIKTLKSYTKSIRKAGFFDKKMNKLVDTKKVEGDTIFLKNKSVRAIVQVQPINFTLLSSHEQEAIISAYKDFLNSLDFPIQIVMRTVNLSLDDYMKKIEKTVLEKENQELVEQFNSFQEFVKEFIENNKVKNRLFYLIVPCSPTEKTSPGTDTLTTIANFFRREKKKTSTETARENLLNQLDIRVKLCQEKLKKCNLLTKRLNTEEIVSLLASFFEGFIEAENNYFNTLTLLEKFETEGKPRKWITRQGEEITTENILSRSNCDAE